MLRPQSFIRLMTVVVMLAGLASAATASADTRIALVIGNAHYQNAPALGNPANDANDVASALGGLGFNTRLLLDGTKRQTDQAIAQFARDAKDADAALFYYSGHGMQFEGRNYVVPIDAELQDEISVHYELTAIDDLKAALQNSRGVKILVLDSCRDNPLAERLVRSLDVTTRDFPKVKGFAPFERTGGMVVAYATQADQTARDGVGRNSPFTRAFLKELQTPRLEVGTLFRKIQEDVYDATSGEQSPELSISLVPEYYLNQNDSDQTVWARVREQGDAAALRDFLARFPGSFYAPDAKARLELIEREANGQSEVEKARKAADDANAAAERLTREQAVRDKAAAYARAREQELEARLAEAEAERVRQQADKEKAAEQIKSDEQAVAALKAQVAALEQEAAKARADAEAAARKAAEAEKAAKEAERPAATATPSPMPSATPSPTPSAERPAVTTAPPLTPSITPSSTPSAAQPMATTVALADIEPLRSELRRLGCFKGGESDWRAPNFQAGLALYARYAKLAAVPTEPNVDLLADLRQRKDGLCPPTCSAREMLVNVRCVAKTCGAGEILSKSGACVAKPAPRPVASNRPTAMAGGRCFTFNGAQYCE